MANRATKSKLYWLPALLALALALCLAASAQAPVTVAVAAGETKTLTRDKLSSGHETFSVSAKGGQTLLVEINLTGNQEADGNDRLEVLAPGSSQPLRSNTDNDEGAMHWIRALPRTGAYRIVVRRPSRKPYSLLIALIDPHDPRIDPGIAADQVHLDLSGLGIKEPFSLQPFSPVVSDELIEPWPAHLGVVTDKLEIRILPIEGIRKTLGDDKDFAPRLEKLQAALRDKKPFAAEDLPFSPYEDSAVDLAMRPEFLEGKSFQALRWVASFSQDPPSAPANPLSYILEGISRNGRYLLLIRGEIVHPSLKTEAELPQDVQQDGPQMQAMRKQVARTIAKAAPDSFQPNLAQLDAIVRSLQLPD